MTKGIGVGCASHGRPTSKASGLAERSLYIVFKEQNRVTYSQRGLLYNKHSVYSCK